MIAFCGSKPRDGNVEGSFIGKVYLKTRERFPDQKKNLMVYVSRIPDLNSPEAIHKNSKSPQERTLTTKKSLEVKPKIKYLAKAFGDRIKKLLNFFRLTALHTPSKEEK